MILSGSIMRFSYHYDQYTGDNAANGQESPCRTVGAGYIDDQSEQWRAGQVAASGDGGDNADRRSD